MQFSTREHDWIAKQALDMGRMGVIFNGVDNKEQIMRLVRYMRYPQQKTSKFQQPPGLRGYSLGNAVFAQASPRLSTSNTPTFGR